MKITISLSPEGQERHATGNPVYAWHFCITVTEAPNDYGVGEVPANYIPVGTLTFDLPSTDSCREGALAQLRNREQEIRAEAEIDLLELSRRKQTLLALTFTGGAQ